MGAAAGRALARGGSAPAAGLRRPAPRRPARPRPSPTLSAPRAATPPKRRPSPAAARAAEAPHPRPARRVTVCGRPPRRSGPAGQLPRSHARGGGPPRQPLGRRRASALPSPPARRAAAALPRGPGARPSRPPGRAACGAGTAGTAPPRPACPPGRRPARPPAPAPPPHAPRGLQRQPRPPVPPASAPGAPALAPGAPAVRSRGPRGLRAADLERGRATSFLCIFLDSARYQTVMEAFPTISAAEPCGMVSGRRRSWLGTLHWYRDASRAKRAASWGAGRPERHHCLGGSPFTGHLGCS